MKTFAYAALAALTLALCAPAQADQLLGQPRINSANQVFLPGGPALGRWVGQKYIATPDAVQIQGPGSTGDASGMSATVGSSTRTIASWLPLFATQASPLLTGTVSLGNQPGATITMGGFDPQLFAQRYATGSTSAVSGANLNDIQVARDQMNNTAPNSFVNYLNVFGRITAPTIGGRQGLAVLVQQDNASSASNGNHNYVGAAFGTFTTTGDNGTAPDYSGGKGAYFGINPYAVLGVGVTNALNLSGAEVNYSARSGSSVAYKSGIQISALPDDAVQGNLYDAGLSLSNQTTTGPGWRDGILFSQANGGFPIAPGGNLLRSMQGPATFLISASGYIQSSAYNRGYYADMQADAQGTLQSIANAPPASSTSACTQGQTAWDATYTYRCVATNTWRRAALSPF